MARLGTSAGFTALILSLASFQQPSSVEACSPPLNAVVMLSDGATIPVDGVVAFDKGSWDLTWLLDNEASPPAPGSSYFQARDVVRMEAEGGIDVPGTLETVADYIVFRPSQNLTPGAYTVTFKEFPSAFEQAIELIADSGTTGPLPTLQATSLHVPGRGNLAACEPGAQDSCGQGGYVARDDVSFAQYALNQTFSSHKLRSQRVTIATANEINASCIGCAELDVLRTTEALPSLTMDLKIIDLRTKQVIYQDQQEVTYDGPLGSTPRDLTAQDFLGTACRTPPEGLEEEWCDKLGPACADGTLVDPRCEELSTHCGDIIPGDEDADDDYCGGYEEDEGEGDACACGGYEDGKDDGESAKANRSRGCSVSAVGSTSSVPRAFMLTSLFILLRSRGLKKARR